MKQVKNQGLQSKLIEVIAGLTLTFNFKVRVFYDPRMKTFLQMDGCSVKYGINQ